MLAAFIYLILVFSGLEQPCVCEGAEESRDAPTPDINDLFPSFNEGDSHQDESPLLYTNISLDIEKLDINKFKQIIDMKMASTLEDDIGLGDSNFTKPRLTNMLLDDTRRFTLIANKSDQSKFKDYSTWYGKRHMFHRGYHIVLHQLYCDMMLQMIYMAKTQVAVIEESENVNTADTGYRIGYISQKCNKLFRKLSRILGFMRRWQYSLPLSTGHIVLHHRMVRLHIDFLFQYWVVTKVDEIYKKRYGDKYRAQIPVYEKSDLDHVGISMENSVEKEKINSMFGPPPGYSGAMPNPRG